MRAQEIDNSLPHLYLDMDGVQADFFSSWAKWHNKKFDQSHVKRYKDIGSREQREQSITELNKEGPEFITKFFATLPPLPGGQKLIAWLRQNRIPFTVLSAPLRNNEDASIAGKKYWLSQHNPGVDAIFSHEKQNFATKNGKPNLLIDDFKKYVGAWKDAGGQSILYRDSDVNSVINQLAQIYKVKYRAS